MLETGCDLSEKMGGSFHRQRAAGHDGLIKALAGDIFHRDVIDTVADADFVGLSNVRVRKFLRQSHFALEPGQITFLRAARWGGNTLTATCCPVRSSSAR